MLQFALANEPIATIVLDGLSKSLCWNSSRSPIPGLSEKCHPTNIIYAIPENFDIAHDTLQQQEKGTGSFFNAIIRYTENVQITADIINRIKKKKSQESWLVVTNGRYATQIDNELLRSIMADVRADIVAVNAEPELLDKREKIRLTVENNIAGFRRLYSDSAELVPCPNDWPHHLFIKPHIIKKLLPNGVFPESFSTLIKKCRSNSFTLLAVNVGGTVLDLDTEGGLLEFCKTRLETVGKSNFETLFSNKISTKPGFVEKVLLGKDVQIDPNAIILGPTIISNKVCIKQGAVINSSIIGPEVRVPEYQLVNNKILKETQCKRKSHIGSYEQDISSWENINPLKNADITYRNWPRFSYARCFKRIADFVLAVIVLILFAPLIPFIALAIKLSFPGPVFFKDKRQGLHGRQFNCLKFRTMVTGADKIQEKLRFVSQVDGPQFKMVNDPRISAVGRFLRDTYIDEIPQFFNVLLGQMSVVGPRPSPESENTLCPFWRDARLSVRPGITGLWQIRRTRIPMKDFQEWILYDTEYVRNLSLKTDLWICWQTTKKLIEDFINQF